MSIILKGQASWYLATDKGGNANVAMMSARRCDRCEGFGTVASGLEIEVDELAGQHRIRCERCHGDGKLINQMPFNPKGMECAMPLSLIEKHGFRFGQLVKVDYWNEQEEGWSQIVVRLVDIGPNEKLCAEGRIIDLTEFAFRQLEDTSKGIIEIEMEVMA
jgi:hypothetical protein